MTTLPTTATTNRLPLLFLDWHRVGSEDRGRFSSSFITCREVVTDCTPRVGYSGVERERQRPCGVHPTNPRPSPPPLCSTTVHAAGTGHGLSRWWMGMGGCPPPRRRRGRFHDADRPGLRAPEAMVSCHLERVCARGQLLMPPVG